MIWADSQDRLQRLLLRRMGLVHSYTDFSLVSPWHAYLQPCRPLDGQISSCRAKLVMGPRLPKIYDRNDTVGRTASLNRVYHRSIRPKWFQCPFITPVPHLANEVKLQHVMLKAKINNCLSFILRVIENTACHIGKWCSIAVHWNQKEWDQLSLGTMVISGI